jgi:hypothetical protein
MRERRLRNAVTTLIAAAKSVSFPACAARLDAIQTLEALGFSKEKVIEARARALDGFSVEVILDWLEGVER